LVDRSSCRPKAISSPPLDGPGHRFGVLMIKAITARPRIDAAVMTANIRSTNISPTLPKRPRA
jgi:hypothetical protein